MTETDAIIVRLSAYIAQLEGANQRAQTIIAEKDARIADLEKVPAPARKKSA